ncbi:MAG: CRTAC1 family protein [Thiotrichales bacterium]|nr:CRTAC1 family protein [Thiotrichales bacterium]
MEALSIRSIYKKLFAMIFCTLCMSSLHAQVEFNEIATTSIGINFERVPSLRAQVFDEIRSRPFNFPVDIALTPVRSRGTPGIVMFDYDNDGDQDIYVTNGPGGANALYQNQLKETGQVSFIDRALSAGVSATAQDSTGVVAGDIDNDGDQDLYVLGYAEPNVLFLNNNDGTFSQSNALSAGNFHSVAASFGDVNGDGLLDVAIANIGSLDDQRLIFVEPYALSEPNQLYINLGGNNFQDVSDTSGIRDLIGVPEGQNPAAPTWSLAMVDYDQDGDVDIFTGNDQGGISPAAQGGFDRGAMHLYRNDGTGHFVDVSAIVGINTQLNGMGMSFGDFNHDKQLDFFVTNLGDYLDVVFNSPELRGNLRSRWYFGSNDGVFTRGDSGNLTAMPLGWVSAALDHDNDGDTDIIFHAGLELAAFIDLSNPGVLLDNTGQGNFDYNFTALANGTNHARRIVVGFATGDLDLDGFVDLVTASNFNLPEAQAITPGPQLGSMFDFLGGIIPTFIPTEEPNVLMFDQALPDFPNGNLSIELNNANTTTQGLSISLLGTKGLVGAGKVNRDAIGAVLTFTPEGGVPVMKALMAGTSYGSSDSLVAHFGLGHASRGAVEILWPGGVKTKVYGIRMGANLTIPELPYSYDDVTVGNREYFTSILRTLGTLLVTREIDYSASFLVLKSALRARKEYQNRFLSHKK